MPVIDYAEVVSSGKGGQLSFFWLRPGIGAFAVEGD